MVVAFALAQPGPALAQIKPRTPLVGFVDRTGKVVVPPVWRSASLTTVGDWVALIGDDGKVGFRNLRTGAAIPFRFEGWQESLHRIGDRLFGHGPEPVLLGGKWGYIDPRGRFVIEPEFAEAAAFDAGGLAIVAWGDRLGGNRLYGLIDKRGRWVGRSDYQSIRPDPGSGLFVVTRGDLSGAMDRQGREVLKPVLPVLGDFGANGLAPASTVGGYDVPSRRYGYVDLTGRFVIPERYREASPFQIAWKEGASFAPPGLARVTAEDGEIAFIDTAGEIKARFPRGAHLGYFSSNGRATLYDRTSNNQALVDTTGRVVSVPGFTRVGEDPGGTGLFPATKNELWGYIREDGGWAIPPRFTSAGSFDRLGQATVIEDKRHWLIDTTGRRLAALPDDAAFFGEGQVARFTVYPGRIDDPPALFGPWRLDRALFEVPKFQSHHFAPVVGEVKLSYEGPSGFRVVLNGARGRVRVISDRGDGKNSVLTSHDFEPAPVDAAPVLAEVLAGFRQVAEPFHELAGLSPADRAAGVAAIEVSAADFGRAWAAFRARVAEMFGPPDPAKGGE